MTADADQPDEPDFAPMHGDEHALCWIPTNERWAQLANPYLLMLRLSWSVMFRTKPELENMLQTSLAGEAGLATFRHLADTIEFFRNCLNLAETAQAWLLEAGEAVSSALAEAGDVARVPRAPDPG